MQTLLVMTVLLVQTINGDTTAQAIAMPAVYNITVAGTLVCVPPVADKVSGETCVVTLVLKVVKVVRIFVSKTVLVNARIHGPQLNVMADAPPTVLTSCATNPMLDVPKAVLVIDGVLNVNTNALKGVKVLVT